MNRQLRDVFHRSLKPHLRRAFNSVGLEVKRHRAEAGNGRFQPTSPYHAAILTLLGQKPFLHIVVVGANDGRTNDPVYPLIKGHLRDQTRVTLFEPQAAILPYLREHYAFHPHHTIINEAIGPGDDLVLYSIDESFWPRMQPSYAAGWPTYRAPTGRTSTLRENVASFASDFVKSPDEIEAAVVETSIRCGTLSSALERHGIEDGVDILQIDAEGFDDYVLAASNIERLQPSVIRFEKAMIPSTRLNSTSEALVDLGYKMFGDGADMLCIRATA